MGSCMNFDNVTSVAKPSGNVGQTAANLRLARQSSIYSMTFDDLQTLGGLGKDLGSMNMQDLLKIIWTAEETQVNSAAGVIVSAPGGNLQRQGSLTLPRKLSQRTVDEVWKDLMKENGGIKDGDGTGVSLLWQREPTLREMTLEEFLARAGVVRQDIQPIGKLGNVGYYGGSTPANGNTNGITIGFQPSAQNLGMFGNHIGSHGNGFSNSSNFMLNGSGVRSSEQQQQQQQQPRPQLQPLFPKQSNVTFASPQLGNNVQQMGNGAQMGSQGATASGVGMTNSSINFTIIPAGVTQAGVMGIAGLRGVTTSFAGGSSGNHLHPESISKGNLDSPSLSSSPYAFDEGRRGRRSASSLEKQVERRRRRMIKNRESAARSRARKQAYTLQLEDEVAKLKEMNRELQKKQAELVDVQDNRVLETAEMPHGGGQWRCLRRTLTGPW